MEAPLDNKMRRKLDRREFKVIHNAVKKILSSKLLLDEDQEIVLAHWKLILFHTMQSEDEFSVLWVKLASLGHLTSLYFNSVIMAGMFLIPFTFAAVKGIYDQYKIKYYDRIIDDLIGAMREVFNFSKTVVQYLKKREDYLTNLRATVGEDIYLLLRKAEESFARQVYKAFKAAAIQTQKATEENCTDSVVNLLAYIDVCGVDLNRFTFQPNEGNFAAAVDSVRREYCLMMSSFLGTLVIKIFYNLNEHSKFYEVMGTTVKKLTDSLEVTLKQKVTFEKLKKLHIINHSEIKKPAPRTMESRMKKVDDLLLYFQTGYDLVLSLNNTFESDVHSRLNDNIKCVVDHLKLSNIQIGILQSLLLIEEVQPTVSKASRETQIFAEPQSGPSRGVICYNDPEEKREDEEYECLMQEDSDSNDNPSYGGYDDDLVREEKDAIISRHAVIVELNSKLLLIRQQRESKVEKDKKIDSRPPSPPCPPRMPVPFQVNVEEGSPTDQQILPFQDEVRPSTSTIPLPPPIPEPPAEKAGTFEDKVDVPAENDGTFEDELRGLHALAHQVASRAINFQNLEEIFESNLSSEEEYDY